MHTQNERTESKSCAQHFAPVDCNVNVLQIRYDILLDAALVVGWSVKVLLTNRVCLSWNEEFSSNRGVVTKIETLLQFDFDSICCAFLANNVSGIFSSRGLLSVTKLDILFEVSLLWVTLDTDLKLIVTAIICLQDRHLGYIRRERRRC